MKRIPVFDVAKALLIISVFWFHIPQIYLNWYHGTNETLMLINSVNLKSFTSFFMVAFFVVSGYFMNATRSLWETIKRDSLTLLLPIVVLSVLANLLYSAFFGALNARFAQYLTWSYWRTGFGYWFIPALFVNKLIMQVLVRYVKKRAWVIVLSLLFCALGLLLKSRYSFSPSVFYYKEALLMCPMTLLGFYCKQYNWEPNRSHLRYWALGYVLTVMWLWIAGNPIDGFNLGSRFSYDYLPMALWLGVSGTAFVFYLSSWLEKSKVLQYMGQLTLPMFCWNFFCIELFIRTFTPLANKGGVYGWIFMISVFICSTLCAFLLSSLLNTKYLRWTLGKWK